MKLILVAGARPNFMKIAPLINAIKKHNASPNCSTDISYILVHTGQHYDTEMSEAFFSDLSLPIPDINLEVGSASHAVQTARIMEGFEKVCLKERPDWIIVVGDVNSTLACSLVAAKLGIRVAHVEAGLRSFDRTMPEEINRLVTDAISDLLFTPSEDADKNLIREGIDVSRIKRVGNIMIDTLIANLDRARERQTFKDYDLREHDYVYVTLHRPSNVDSKDSLTSTINCLTQLSKRLPVVFPVHPRTKKFLTLYGLWPSSEVSIRFKVLEPLGYIDSISLVDKARFVLTDSGGLQEETTFLKIPCLTLRPNTERPITVIQGTNKLTSLETIEKDIQNIITGSGSVGQVPELWDGLTGERIVKILVSSNKEE